MKSTVVTVPSLPIVHTTRAEREPPPQRYPLLNDPWFLITLGTALLASVLAWKYAYDQHWTMLYADAHSHLMIARRVIDSSQPGLAQLGGVWLPLPHLIMVPLIWSNYLWQSGLAGSLTSMFCFVVTAIFLYLTILKLVNQKFISFVGSLVFILNPNVLYLQSTPLSELTLAMTMVITCYYFLSWAQTDKLSDLIRSAASAFFMSLARYDGWAVFLAAIFLIWIIGFLKKHTLKKIISNTVLFGWLGGLAIILWFFWNYLIFEDPLYFQHGQYSAQTQQKPFILNRADRTYHSVYYALHDYFVVIIEILGPILFIVGICGLVFFILQKRSPSEFFATLLYLIPFPFYVLSLFTGQAIIFAPGAYPANVFNHWFNDRYGLGIIAPAGIFIAIFLSQSWFYIQLLVKRVLKDVKLSKVFSNIVPLIFIVVILFQSNLTFQGGIITLQDGMFGASCFHYSDLSTFLIRHYNGGLILDDPSYNTTVDFAEANIELRNVIYQGSGKLWSEALSDPSRVVDWVIINKGDIVSQYIDENSISFNSKYQLLAKDYYNGASLYYLRGMPPLPSKEISTLPYQNYYYLCGTFQK